jgi:glycosyltransferase involved in cell wall biosynthesis
MIPHSSPGSISAVVPVYNGEAHLMGALRSCLAQTRTPDEIIIVDDGSMDGSLTLVTRFASESPIPVRVISQENSGQSRSRNNGVALAGGEYVAFLDQDDEWHPNFLESVAAALDANQSVAWSYCDFDSVDATGRMQTRGYIRSIGQSHPKLSVIDIIGQNCMVLPSASVLRRRVFTQLGGFDVRLKGYEDDDLFLRAFQAGWEAAFLPTSLVKYRIHSDGSSAQASFRSSRLIYFENVCSVLSDEPRRAQWFVSDILRPRLLHTTFVEYSCALNLDAFAEACEICKTIEVLLSGTRPSLVRRWGLTCIQKPRFAKIIISLIQNLPLVRRILPDGLFIR